MPGPLFDEMDKGALVKLIKDFAAKDWPWRARSIAVDAAVNLNEIVQYRMTTGQLSAAITQIHVKLDVPMPTLPDATTLASYTEAQTRTLAQQFYDAFWDYEVRVNTLTDTVRYYTKVANPASYPDKDTFTTVWLATMNFIRQGRGLPDVT